MELNTFRVFIGRLFITTEEGFHEVERYHASKKLRKGFGYILNDYVYIYRGKKEKFRPSEMLPGIYLNIHGEHEFVPPNTVTDKVDYSIHNIIELDTQKIINDILEQKEDFLDPEDIEVINNNQEIFKPTFKEEDDFLKYAVKKAILDKQVNLKNYKSKFPNQYALNNMKSGLNKETKMTVTNFDSWCEILGLKWKMVIEDAGTDKISPLPERIDITSDDF